MDYLNSKCGYVSRSGRECGNWAVEDSPVNLCFDHLRQAYEYCFNNVETVSKRYHDSSTRCPKCQHMAVDYLEMDDGIRICRYCGHKGRAIDFPDKPRPGRKTQQKPFEFDDKSAVVYYIKHGDRIKIGTSTSWHKRLLALPHDELLALEHGGPRREQERHTQFIRDRIRRTEWFTITDELMEHISSVRRTNERFEDSIKRHNSNRAA